jgi:hypothetical protein
MFALFFSLRFDVVIVLIIHPRHVFFYSICAFLYPISTIIIIRKQQLIHAIWPHHTFFLLIVPHRERKMVFLKQIEWEWKKAEHIFANYFYYFFRFLFFA